MFREYNRAVMNRCGRLKTECTSHQPLRSKWCEYHCLRFVL